MARSLFVSFPVAFCYRAGRPCPAPPLSGELTRKVLS